MKNIIFTTLILLPFAIVSCQKQEVNNKANEIIITGEISSDESLKTAFINPSVNWLGGTDKIGVFSDFAYTTTPGNPAVNVEYTAQSTGSSSLFSSTTPIYFDDSYGTHCFSAYYPYAPGTFPDPNAWTAIPVSLPAAQTQAGATTNHIGLLDFEVAKQCISHVPGGPNPVLAFSFNHVFTILKFNITCASITPHTLTQISLTKTGGTSDWLALNPGNIFNAGQETPAPGVPYLISITEGGSLNVTLATSLPIGSVVSPAAYMMILPGDHTGTGNFTINFKNENTTIYTLTKDGKYFERGNVYTITVPIPTGVGGWEE